MALIKAYPWRTCRFLFIEASNWIEHMVQYNYDEQGGGGGGGDGGVLI